MYNDGRSLHVILPETADDDGCACDWERGLRLARGEALPALHPLQQRRLLVSNRAPYLDVGRTVSFQAPLGEPGETELQQRRGFPGREQQGHRGRRLPERRSAVRDRRFRVHLKTPFLALP
jgi:hypothetical protein